MKARFLLCAVLGALCLTCFIAPCVFSETLTLDGIRYDVRDGFATFAGFAEGTDTVMVHAMVDGYRTEYSSEQGWEENTSVKELTVSQDVTGLEQISNIESLLYKCTALERITLPASLTSIGSCLANSGVKLQAFVVAPDNVSYQAVDGVLFSKDRKTLLVFPTGKGGTYDIPLGTESIDSGAFGYNDNLERLSIPEGIVTLEDGTFQGTTALKEIDLPASLQRIVTGALPYSGALEQILVADGNPVYKSVNGVLFSKDGKTLLSYPSGRIGQYEIPQGTTDIAQEAFGGSEKLTALSLPEGITELKDCTLSGLNAMTQLNLPASLQKIGIGALPCYGDLYEITLADGNEFFQVYEGALFSRDGKTLLVYPAGREGPYDIPAGTMYIDSGAFGGNGNLTAVTVPDGVAALPEYLFNGNAALERIELPASLTEIGENALPRYGALKRVEIAQGNPRYKSIDGVLFQGEELIFYPPMHGLSYDVPTGTKQIQDSAFENCDMLETISIPRSVSRIGDGTFYNCTSLSRVSLPVTLIEIGRLAFANCIALDCVTLPPNLAILGDAAFHNCPAISMIKIPDSVKEMGTNVLGGHNPDFVLYAKKNSQGYWHAWEYNILWAEPGGVPETVNPSGRQTQSAVVNNVKNQEQVKLYAKPSTESKSFGKYPNGTTVQVLETSGEWAHVQIYKAEGYMSLDSLMLTDKYNSLRHITWGRKRQDIGGPLKLYAAPYEKAPSENIREDVSMRILDTVGVWYYVRTENLDGYVQVQNLHVAYSMETAYDGNISIYVVGNPDPHDRLNLRKEPSSKSQSLGRYFNGTQVEVIGEVKDGWAFVRVDGQEGYMMFQYLLLIDFGGEKSLWGQG